MEKKGSQVLFFRHYNSSGVFKHCCLKTRSHFQKALFNIEIKGVITCLRRGTKNKSHHLQLFFGFLVFFFFKNKTKQQTNASSSVLVGLIGEEWRRNNHIPRMYIWEQASEIQQKLIQLLTFSQSFKDE